MRGIFLCALLVAASGCLQPATTTSSEIHIAPPTLTAGDYWTYSNGETLRILAAERRSIDGVEAVRLTWGDRDAKETSDWWFVVDVRVSDGAEIARFNRNVEGGVVGLHYSAPCPHYYGSHEASKPWTVSCKASFGPLDANNTMQVSGGFWADTTFEIIGSETVTVPAGPFETWQIEIRRETSGLQEEEWYSTSACQPVREFDQNRPGQGGFRELISYRCAAQEAVSSQRILDE